MPRFVSSISRGLIGGVAAVLLVGALSAVRIWWRTSSNFTGGVDLGPILKPELGAGVAAIFVVGFLIAWWFM
jgi:hypothetical protein